MNLSFNLLVEGLKVRLCLRDKELLFKGTESVVSVEVYISGNCLVLISGFISNR